MAASPSTESSSGCLVPSYSPSSEVGTKNSASAVDNYCQAQCCAGRRGTFLRIAVGRILDQMVCWTFRTTAAAVVG